jgi:hypothetical protein
MNTSKPNLDQLRRLKELFGVGDGNSGDELSPSQFVQALKIARTSIPNTATAGTDIRTKVMLVNNEELNKTAHLGTINRLFHFWFFSSIFYS